MTTQQTQTTRTPATFVTVIGTIGADVVSRKTNTGMPVANSALYDNKRAEGDRAYTLTAFAAAVPVLQGFAKGDLVQVRARLVDKHYTLDGKDRIERILIMVTKGTKLLSAKKAMGATAPAKQAA